jgi:hypothetical protein
MSNVKGFYRLLATEALFQQCGGVTLADRETFQAHYWPLFIVLAEVPND